MCRQYLTVSGLVRKSSARSLVVRYPSDMLLTLLVYGACKA